MCTDQVTSRPRILIADDSRVIRKVITQILKQDFDLIEKEDGEAAWQTLQSDPVDVVISDMEMPRMDGCALLSCLRASDRPVLQNMPVIVITGAEDEATKSRAFECGATDFITKPIDRIELLARIRGQAKLEQTNRRLSAIAASGLEDPETSLSNKRGLLQQGASDLAYARRHGTGLAVIRLNVVVKEGSLAGAGAHLRARMREEDTLGYLGNNAFAILSPCAGREEAMLLSARLRHEFMALRAMGVFVRSYGMVSAEEADTDTAELLLAAELAIETCDEAGEPASAIDLIQPAEPVSVDPEQIPERPGPVPEPDGASVVIDGSGEDLVIEALPGAIGRDTSGQETPMDEAGVVASPPSLDAALEMIRSGRFEAVRPHLRTLALKSLPLIELCNSAHGLGLTLVVQSLRDKLTPPRTTP